MATKITLVDETVITVNDQYNQVDDTYEYTAFCANYTELSEIAKKLTDENLKKITITDAYNNDMTYTNMTCSEPKISILSDEANVKYIIRLKPKTKEDEKAEAMEIAIQKFGDEDALAIKSLYPEFESVIGRSVEKDFKLVYYNILYKTAQATLIQEQYKPGATGTESIYTRIDETHKGTDEDPIPYFGNQILEQGKIYLDEEGSLWLCTNGSGIAVFDKLVNLPTFVARYTDAAGTPEDPIVYAGGLALVKDKYYTQDDVIYKCIRDSEIPVYDALSTMIGNYVEVYEPEEPEEPSGPPVEDVPTEDGSIDHPYAYTSGSTIFKDYYYTQDGILYIGIRDSEIPLYHNLKDLVDLYVKVVDQEEAGGEEEESEETLI